MDTVRLTSVVKPMRNALCETLELCALTKQTWQERYRAGIEAPLLRLVDRSESEGNFIAADNLLKVVLQIPAFKSQSVPAC